MIRSLLDQLWELDKEQSYARFTIIPIREGDERCYQWHEEVEIRPYPNPFGFGGMWGMGVAHSQKEVKRLIKGFRGFLREWQKRGLELEVIHKPEMTRTEYRNERRLEWLERKGKDDKQARDKIAQLSLIEL